MTELLLLSTYGLLATAAVVLDARARRGGSASVPTLAEVTSAVMRWGPARVSVLAGWLWLGWHLFAR
ncbi:MAG: DUF6186 family protein [Actinomycetota bacterium]|nr:DUF6186 family protein [Actinomycetota bacterium]